MVTGDRTRAAAARRAYPGVRIEATSEALFERAGEHDLVVVASPNDTHVELATRAIDLGIPVVVDKPLAPTAGAAAGLVEHAERAGVPLTVFHNRRWDSDQLTLRRLIGEGRLGEVLRFESRFERWRPELRSDGMAGHGNARPRAAACCSTSAPTWSTRPCSCSARSPRSTARSRIAVAAPRTTTPSWRSSTPAAFEATSGRPW